jgi:hypothetical protein
MAQRHEWESDSLGDLARRQFMGRVQVGMQEGDGDGGEALQRSSLELALQRFTIERADHCARSVEPLIGLDHPGVERGRLDDGQREQVRPRLVADQHGISEAPGGDEQGLGPGPLQERVGGDGGAHLDGVDAGGGEGFARGRAQDAAHGRNGGVGIGVRGGEQLQRGLAAVVRPPCDLADHIGESPAAVDPEAPGPVQNLTRLPIVFDPPHS